MRIEPLPNIPKRWVLLRTLSPSFELPKYALSEMVALHHPRPLLALQPSMMPRFQDPILPSRAPADVLDRVQAAWQIVEDMAFLPLKENEFWSDSL